MWRAEQLGGPEHIGWTPDTYRAADMIDAIMANTAVTANIGSRGKPKMPKPISRPKVVKEQVPAAKELDDNFVSSLVAMIS
jgi:hypothetical protein